jgi:predicted MFS family arabinose efflux permease
MFTIMLLPFIIFEAPLGRTFDRTKSVRDTLIAGYTLMILMSTAAFFTHSKSFLVWAGILFVSRIGASFVEVSCDYAFFRRVTDRDAGYISIYRSIVPLSFLVVPTVGGLIASVALPYVFIATAICLISGIIISYNFKYPL